MRSPTVTMNAPIIDESRVLMHAAAPPGKMRYDSTKWETNWSSTCSVIMTVISAGAMQIQMF